MPNKNFIFSYLLAPLILLFYTNLLIPAAQNNIWQVGTAIEYGFILSTNGDKKPQDAESFIINSKTSAGTIIAGIFDGINGNKASNNLNNFYNKTPNLQALEKLINNKTLLEKLLVNRNTALLSSIKNEPAKSTAILVLANNNYLTLAYAGNSQALIGFQDGTVLLTEPHETLGSNSNIFGNANIQPTVTIYDLKQKPIDFVIIASASFWNIILKEFENNTEAIKEVIIDELNKNKNSKDIVNGLLEVLLDSREDQEIDFISKGIGTKKFSDIAVIALKNTSIIRETAPIIAEVQAPVAAPVAPVDQSILKTTLNYIHFFISALTSRLSALV